MAWPISDSFTGTSGTAITSHAADSGATWTVHSSYATGAAVLSNANELRANSGNNGLWYASDTPPSADYDLTVTLDFRASWTAGEVGVAARIDTATDTYYRVCYETSNGYYRLLKSVAGSASILGTFFSTPSAPSTHTLKFQLRGPNLDVFVDGVNRISNTDSGITAAGRAGIFARGAYTDTVGIHLDDFSASSPQGPGFAGDFPDVARSQPNYATYPGTLRSPLDAGLTPIHAAYPDTAPGGRRATASFTTAMPPPGDAGQFLVMPGFPDRAPGLPRHANYVRIVASMPDVGTSPIPGRFPDEYRPLPRRANTGSSWPSPPDQGNTPIPGRFPDVARGPSRSAASAYFWVNQRSYDNPVGVPGPIPANRPDIARAAPRFQAWTVQSPMDLGIDISPPLHQTFPDRAPTAPRFQAWTVRSPVDAGVIFPAPPILSSDPDIARAAPRFQAWHVRSPLEPVPPPAIAPMLPAYPEHRERKGRQATSQYFVGLRPPMEVATISYRIYANAGDGGPIDYDTPIDSTTSTTWTSGVLSASADYRFAVRAFDSGSGLEDKNLDASVQLKTDATSKDITRIPYAPLGLVAHNLKAI